MIGAIPPFPNTPSWRGAQLIFAFTRRIQPCDRNISHSYVILWVRGGGGGEEVEENNKEKETDAVAFPCLHLYK